MKLNTYRWLWLLIPLHVVFLTWRLIDGRTGSSTILPFTLVVYFFAWPIAISLPPENRSDVGNPVEPLMILPKPPAAPVS